MLSATDFKNIEHNDSTFAFDFCQNYSHELNITGITLPLATSQATKICEQDINFHLYPTLTVITVSKSQSQTVSNVLSTLTLR